MKFPSVSLSQPYQLSKDHIEAYRRNGHILLKSVCSPEEIQYIRPLILGVVEEVV